MKNPVPSIIDQIKQLMIWNTIAIPNQNERVTPHHHCVYTVKPL